MVHHVVAIGGALLFASSAVHKLRAPRAFAVALSGHGLLPTLLLAPVARLLPVVEVTLAAALLLPGSAPIAGPLASVLLVVYGAAMASNLLRGRTEIDCGCGGPGGERPISWGLVARNFVVGALLASLLLPTAGRLLVALDAVHGLLALGTGVLLYAATDVALANAARSRLVPGSAA